MARFVCVFVSQFPTQTLTRLRPELLTKAVAILEGDRPFEQICSLNQAARRLGLERGMSRAEAEMVSVNLLSRSTAEELASKSALLFCLASFCPSVEEFPAATECVYVLDLQGTERLLGSVASAMRHLRTAIRRLGLTARLASSANFHAALCLARSGHGSLTCISAGAEADALSPLPLHVLDLSEEHATTFMQWGIRTLGELGQLPEVELITRLGQEGQRLRQLSLGNAPHHFQPIPVPLRLEEFIEFDSPVDTLDSLLFVLNAMLTQLISRATTRALALASITLICKLEAAPSHIRSIQPSLPSVDRAVFLKLLQLDLDAHPPCAGVVALQLTAEPGQNSKVQTGLFSPQLPESMRLEVTLARLKAIVGEDRVGKSVLKDTHQHDSFRMQKFTIEPFRPLRSPVQQTPALRRLRPCVAIKIELQGDEPHAFWHERLRYDIQRLYGPWRFSGEWWTGLCWAVERWDFAAQSTNSLLIGVLLRNRVDRSWWLEAVYD